MLIKDIQWEGRTAGFLRLYLGAGYTEKSVRLDVHSHSLNIDYYKHLQLLSMLHLL